MPFGQQRSSAHSRANPLARRFARYSGTAIARRPTSPRGPSGTERRESLDRFNRLNAAELSDALRAASLVAWKSPVVWIGVACRILIRRAGDDAGTFHRSGIDTGRSDRDGTGPRSARTTEPV